MPARAHCDWRRSFASRCSRSVRRRRAAPTASSPSFYWKSRAEARRLYVARNRAVVRRHPVGQVEPSLIHVAPTPTFRRVIALDDRMASAVEMLRGVPVRRVVAATNVTTAAAEPQMHPRRADLQALLAAERARRD